MLSFLPGPLRAVAAFLLLVVNTLFWTSLLLTAALLKLLIPLAPWQPLCSAAIHWLAGSWIACNNLGMRLLYRIDWEVSGTEGLLPDRWYLVVCNHQSWVDIIVLQKIFHGKIPFLKFFIKKELIWVPVLGMAWWALDFPFMKRYSKSFIEKNPHLAGRDLAITRKACEKYMKTPVSIMNFVEGTRFTHSKHIKQNSPHANLLRPRAGGVAFVLSAMAGRLNRILDVTIVYPGGKKSLWDLLCGRIDRIRVNVTALPVNDEILAGYFTDEGRRQPFHDWINALWHRKDETFDDLVEGP